MEREKALKVTMNVISVFTVICSLISVITIGIGISGLPIPWVDAIVLFILTALLSIYVYKYHTEYKYNL